MSRRDVRLERVAKLLEDAGITGAYLSTAGAHADIAVIEGVDARGLAPLAPAIRELGFRFVALDLTNVQT